MDKLQLKMLQKKIADYPERISKLQERQNMIVTPSATEIGPALKGMNAYLLFLKAEKNSYQKLFCEASGDYDKLKSHIDAEGAGDEGASDSARISLVQLEQYMASIQNYINLMDSQIDNGEVVKEKLTLAQKQKENIDVANLLIMIKKGDGYRP